MKRKLLIKKAILSERKELLEKEILDIDQILESMVEKCKHKWVHTSNLIMNTYECSKCGKMEMEY